MIIGDIGNIIKTRRKELAITQSDLAELADVTKRTVVKLENGEGNPTLFVLNKILNVIGMDVKVEVIKNY